MKTPKISIIVPVYKVEPYIRRCIDSILSQTFKDFELILVDDGSPDRCGEICDEYALKDSRIKVIHKKNGGLSSARNVGLDIAQGEYIGFVDSDDYIELNMYETLYDLCKNNNADIGVISSRIVKNKKMILRETSGLKIFNKERAMEELAIGKYFDEVVWTKLFKNSTIGNLRFKLNIKHEDTEFTYRVIDRCQKLVYVGKPMYNYIIKDNSIMAFSKKEFCIDHIKIYEEMYGFYKRNYPQYKDLILYRLTDSSFGVLNRMLVKNVEKLNKEKIAIVIGILKKYFWQIIKLKQLNKNLKILLIIMKVNEYLYKKVNKILKIKK